MTVVFADVVGSTALAEHADPEAAWRTLDRWFEAMRAVLERHGGLVEKFIGDAVVAVFGVPVLHEDDALRAVRAAVAMRDALDALGGGDSGGEPPGTSAPRIDMRVGVNTGEALVGQARAGGSIATGDAVNVAARLQQAARPGEILLGEATWRLVRGAVTAETSDPLRVGGRESAVAAHRLISVDAAAEAIPRSRGARLVGREDVLRALGDAFERVVAGSSPGLVTVLGSPGIGKTRLVSEFVAGLTERARVLRGRCLAYGEAITWWPVIEIVRQAAGAPNEADGLVVRARLASLLRTEAWGEPAAAALAELFGTAAVARRDEHFWAMRRLLQWLAVRRPVVVVLDDLESASPTLLDLVDHLAQRVTDVPLLIVCVARPELLDARPTWGAVRIGTTIALPALAHAEVEQLIQELTDRADLGAVTSGRIAEAAGGNPLYLEQIIAMLFDDGVLVRTDSRTRVVGALPELVVPPTIRAIVAARLDRLRLPEQMTVQRAALVGLEFGSDEVEALMPETERPQLARFLDGLARRELIAPVSERGGVFRFQHALIRDAAYESLVKAERADLHERFAGWLEANAGRQMALDEIAGHHLAQAVALRDDLGEDVGRTAQLRLRAGGRLARAGRRARQRDDIAAAVALLESAADIVAAFPGDAADTLLELALAHSDAFEWGEAEAAARAAVGRSSEAGDAGRAYRARMIETVTRGFVGPAVGLVGATELADEARAWAEPRRDLETLMMAEWLAGYVEVSACRWDAAQVRYERELDLAIRLGRLREADDARRLIANGIGWGCSPVADGMSRLRALEAAASGQLARAVIVSREAMLEAAAGRRDEALALLGRAREVLDDLGTPWALGLAPVGVRLLLDEVPATIVACRQQLAALRAAGAIGPGSTALGMLAVALVRAGEIDEAASTAEECRNLASADDLVTQIDWRTALAGVALARGDTAAALEMSHDAVAIARNTDQAIDAVQALLGAAEARHAAGLDAAAAAAIRDAAGIVRRRGWVAGDRRLTALAEALHLSPIDIVSGVTDGDAHPRPGARRPRIDPAPGRDDDSLPDLKSASVPDQAPALDR